MERADIVGMSNGLREAFLAAGKDVEEKRTVTGSAFFITGHAIGQFETRANVLRARLWLGEKERRSVEARPTYDADSGWLHVVSEEDVAFVRGLVQTAYRAASSGGAGAAPSSPRSGSTPWTVESGPAVRKRVVTAAVGGTTPVERPAIERPVEKKKGASRRPPTKI